MIPFTSGKDSSTINFLSGFNNISSSPQTLNKLISYPQISPLKLKIVPDFLVVPKKL